MGDSPQHLPPFESFTATDEISTLFQTVQIQYNTALVHRSFNQLQLCQKDFFIGIVTVTQLSKIRPH